MGTGGGIDNTFRRQIHSYIYRVYRKSLALTKRVLFFTLKVLFKHSFADFKIDRTTMWAVCNLFGEKSVDYRLNFNRGKNVSLSHCFVTRCCYKYLIN